MKLAILSAALLATLTPAAAMAANDPAPVADPSTLEIANKIVAIALPPASRMEMIDRVTSSMMKSMQASCDRMPGMQDPGFKAIIDDFLSSSIATSHTAVEPLMPELTAAMAQGYTRVFTREDLEQVLAFAQTPAGTRYLQRSANLMQDPGVQAVFSKLVSAVQERQAGSVKALKARIADYLAAHPAVAKEMGEQNAH